MKAFNLAFAVLLVGCGGGSRGTAGLKLDAGVGDLAACKGENFAGCKQSSECCPGLTCTGNVCINPLTDMAMAAPKPDLSKPQGGSHMGACDEENPRYPDSCDDCYMTAQDTGGDCEGALDACGGDASCVKIINCLNNCPGGDQQCFMGCVNAGTAKGKMLLQALFACLEAACPACLGDGDCSGGMSCMDGVCQ